MAKKPSTKPARVQYVSPKIASEVLGVVPQTLRRWAKAGKIAFIKLPNGHSRYAIESITSCMIVPVEPEPVAPTPMAPKPTVVDNTPSPEQAARLVAMQQQAALEQLLAMVTQSQGQPVPAPIAPKTNRKAGPTKADLAAAVEAIAGM